MEETASTAHPRGRSWRPWGVLAAVFVLNAGFFAYSIAPASVLPLLVDAFGVGKAAAGTSISAVFLTWAILQIPGGYLLDRYDNRRLLFLGGAVFVLSSTAGLLAPSYPLFLLTRSLGGVSAVFVFVGSVNVLRAVHGEAAEATVLGLFVASPPFGIALAQFGGPLLAGPYGWRAPILAATVLSLFGLAAAVALVRTPVETGGRATGAQFLAALRNRSVVLVSVASFCTYAVWTFLLTWMPTYGTEVLRVDLASAGAATALVPLAGMLSRPAGGWVSARLGGRLRPLVAASFVGTVLVLYLLSVAPSPMAFAVLLASAGAAVNFAVGLYLVAVNALAAPGTRGTSLSVLITFSQVGNLSAPVVGGVLIEAVSWAAGFGFAAALALLGLVTIVLSPTLD